MISSAGSRLVAHPACLEQRKAGKSIPIPRRRHVVVGSSSSSRYSKASVDASTVLSSPPTSVVTHHPPLEASVSPAAFRSRVECQGRNRARFHTKSIPADARSYVVAGQCEVQLSTDLVVGASTYGNSQYCQMTIEFHDSEGKLCTYGEWKAEQEKKSMETTAPACESHWSSIPEGRADEVQRHHVHEENRVRLEANNLVLLGISAGRHHMTTVYQRLFSELPPSGYQSQML